LLLRDGARSSLVPPEGPPLYDSPPVPESPRRESTLKASLHSTQRRFAPIVPLILAAMASQGLLVVLAPTIVDVGRSFDASVGAVGQARSIAAAAAIGCSLLVPTILSRVGIRGLLAVGVALAVISSAIAAAAPTLTVYLASHLLIGAGLGALLSAGFAGVAACPPGERGWAMGYVASANALAWVVANPVIGVLTDTVSWRLAQLVPAVIALGALAAAPRVRPIDTSPMPQGALRTLAGEPGARRWAAGEMLAYCAWAGALLTYIGAYFIQRYDISESLTGLLLAAGAASYIVASVRSGRLTRRFPREPLMRAAALAMSALLVIQFAFESVLVLPFALFCMIALLAGVRTPASAGLGMAQLPTQPGVMMAARTAMTQLGYLIGAALAGVVLSIADYEVLGIALAVVMVASTWAMSGVPDPEQERRVPSPTPG
jgi:predicted MFS family arabinose efflux permease